MYDPSVNFFTVQREFNQWWDLNKQEVLQHSEEEESEVGEGWKIYKRWEREMLPRMLATGGNRQAAFDSTEFKFFENRKKHGAQRSGPTWNYIGPVQSFDFYFGWKCKGRLNCVRFDPLDKHILYVGAPSGGLWKSTDLGQNWQLLNTDNLGQIGITDICINPLNPQTIYIATGDYANSASLSIGILKSTDGGQTWNTTGLNWTTSQSRLISRILINPVDTNIMIAATNAGVFRTTDAGANWTLVTPQSFNSMEFNTANADIIYAANKRFYKSVNGGSTWGLVIS
ncbi:MAG: hypothetical protein JWO06_1712, partial [Bacteroidota bacterium]|nr:hypothetical protein [Bacteroidota bacterium]